MQRKKALKQRVYVAIFAPSKIFLSFRAMKVLPELASKFQEKLVLRERVPEGEFIKKCMLSAVSLICPSEIKNFQNVSFSRTTIQRRIENNANNITEHLR